MAAPKMSRATVVSGSSSKVSSARTNSGHFVKRGKDETIRRIEERIANYTNIPSSHGESMQVRSLLDTPDVAEVKDSNTCSIVKCRKHA